MNILIAAVGRLKAGPELALVESFRQRIPWSMEIKEVEPKRFASGPAAIEKTSQALLDLVPKGSRVICLVSQGRDLSSEAFAQRIQAWRDDAVPCLAFLIGGPDGLSKTAVKHADLTLSFGRVTWPHMLARVMLLEQLYRAHCILTDHPYHRGH